MKGRSKPGRDAVLGEQRKVFDRRVGERRVGERRVRERRKGERRIAHRRQDFCPTCGGMLTPTSYCPTCQVRVVKVRLPR